MKADGGSKDMGIPEDNFSDFNISVCGGLCYDKKKSRMKLHAGLAVTSVANASIKLLSYNQEEYQGSWHAYYDLAFAYKLKGK